MSQFILLPWEYTGADFNPNSHATTRMDIGGKKRNFVLKMRDGVIYFKEPSRGAVYATPNLLDEKLARDPIGLISAWQKEIAAGNYGAFLLKRDYFPRTATRGRLLFIVRADGSGWMKEHFDTQWFEIPQVEEFAPFSVWDAKAAESAVETLLQPAQALLINRILDPSVRELEPPRFINGTRAEFESVVLSAALLFQPHLQYAPPALILKGHSAFAKGDIEGYGIRYFENSPSFSAIWRPLYEEMPFVGIDWHEGGELVDGFSPKRTERYYRAGMEKWGENWRGNWAPRRAHYELPLPFRSATSHEKLEAAVKIRDWAAGKPWQDEIEAILEAALK